MNQKVQKTKPEGLVKTQFKLELVLNQEENSLRKLNFKCFDLKHIKY